MVVDCVVDIGGGNYREIQIKYRENKAIFPAKFTRPRDNFFIDCWLNDHERDNFWTIPSKIFHKLGRHGVSGNPTGPVKIKKTFKKWTQLFFVVK